LDNVVLHRLSQASKRLANTVYFIAASIKDLGKKLFAFSKMEIKQTELFK